MFDLLVHKMLERKRREMRDLTMAVANGSTFANPFGGGEAAYRAWLAQQQPAEPSKAEVASSWAAVTAQARQMQALDPERFGNAIRIGRAVNRYRKPEQPPEMAAQTLEEFRAMIADKEKPN